MRASLAQQKTPNKACNGFLGVCGFEKHFSRFKFFLLSNIFPARPKSANANRWAASHYQKTKPL